MPFQVSVTINTADTLAALAGRRDQMPFAAALALTRAAVAVKDAERREMIDVFANPTPWTLNSLRTTIATKENLTAVVSLVSDTSSGTPADVYLTPEIRGGSRELKKFEYAFRSAGVLPSSMFMVPGQGARIDQYGNMGAGQITALLAYFSAFGITYQAGFTSNVSAAGKAKLAKGSAQHNSAGFVYFVSRPGDRLFPGIWQRFQYGGKGNRGGALKPIIMFVDNAHYQAIFDFDYVAQITVEKQFPALLQAATQQALATARPV